MRSGFRSALGEDTSERQGVQQIISSNVWTIPVVGVATVAVFRDQIQELIEDLTGRMPK